MSLDQLINPRSRASSLFLALIVAVPVHAQTRLAPAPSYGSLAQQPAPVSPSPGEHEGPRRSLSLDAAVELALDENLSLQIERVNPQLQDLSIAEARTAWTPNLISGISSFSQDTPANSFLSGGELKVSDDQFGARAGVDQLLPWGASYSVLWDGTRSTTTNIFSSFDPTIRSGLNAAFVQPLLRNFKIDASRQQLLISEKNREISDVQLRETVVTTIREVKRAYWDLVFSISALDVQRQSLELAQESLRNTRTRVEVGTMAAIDIVEAESEVARNEEGVILAEAAIEQAQDRLRALLFDPSTPDFWNIRIEPTDPPMLQTQALDVDAAVLNALDRRTDLARVRKTLEATDINIRYFRNQTLPQVNLEVRYGVVGLGGTQLIRGEGFPGPVIDEKNRSFGSVLNDIFANDFPTWSLGVTVGYPLGTSRADAGLARARLQRSQAQTQIRSEELQVATEVRQVARDVSTNLKRVEATRAARTLAERRLEAEQKKFSVGMSTSFLVFQAQRDLSEIRNNELRATLDYSQSLVDFEAVQEASVGAAPGVVVSTNALTPQQIQQTVGVVNQLGDARAVATSLTGQQR